MKNIILVICLAITGSAALAQDAGISLEFQIKKVGPQKILVIEGTQAEGLMSLMPSNSQLGENQRKGEMICGQQPEPGVGVKTQCYMLVQ